MTITDRNKLSPEAYAEKLLDDLEDIRKQYPNRKEIWHECSHEKINEIAQIIGSSGYNIPLVALKTLYPMRGGEKEAQVIVVNLQSYNK